jgi:hypothetical protein
VDTALVAAVAVAVVTVKLPDLHPQAAKVVTVLYVFTKG